MKLSWPTIAVFAVAVLGVASAPTAAHEGHEEHDQSAATTATKHRSALALGAAIAADGALWVVGLDGSARLFLQSTPDRGITWSERLFPDLAGDVVSADGENHPKLLFGPAGQLVVSYTRPLAKPYTGEIRMIRSGDGGRSFSAPVTVHRDRQVITHRFDSIAFDRRGVLHAVWIDKRDAAASIAPGAAKSASYRGAAIYRNESRDGGATFGPDIRLADHSCECCRIALAPTADGDIAALWRHVFAPNIRDHAFAILGRSSGEPVRATYDDWKMDACPHHGPGLAAAIDGGFHAVWFGLRGGRAAVRYGRLSAAGQPVGEPRELPDAGAEHADVMADGDFVAIVWRSFDGKQTRLRAWLSTDGGTLFKLRELSATVDENDQPRLVQSGPQRLVVWRTAEDIRVYALAP